MIPPKVSQERAEHAGLLLNVVPRSGEPDGLDKRNGDAEPPRQVKARSSIERTPCSISASNHDGMASDGRAHRPDPACVYLGGEPTHCSWGANGSSSRSGWCEISCVSACGASNRSVLSSTVSRQISRASANSRGPKRPSAGRCQSERWPSWENDPRIAEGSARGPPCPDRRGHVPRSHPGAASRTASLFIRTTYVLDGCSGSFLGSPIFPRVSSNVPGKVPSKVPAVLRALRVADMPPSTAQQTIDRAAQFRQFRFDDSPHDLKIDAEVVVNDLVAQSGDLLPRDVWLA